MQRCILPSSARAVSKQLILPNGRGLVRVPRRAFADAAVVPRRSVAKSLRRIVFFSTLATGTFYAGSALVSFNSQAYHDFFVENVPLGAAVVQFAEDHDWDDLDLDSVTEGVVALGGAVGAAVNSVTSLVSPPKEETKIEKAASKTRETKDITLARGAEAKHAALATGKDAKDVVSRKATDARTTTTSTAHSVKDTAIETKDAMVAKAKAAKDSVKAAVAPVTDKVKAAASSMVTTVVKSEEKVSAVTRSQVSQFGSEIERLVHDAEHVLSGKPISDLLNAAEGAVKDAADNVADHVATPEKVQDEAKGNIYNAPLPLGFEPPPGFSRPAPPPKPKTSATKADGKVETTPAPPPLPLLAPAVAALGASEPVISQLAGTIDTLASYLNAVPTASTAARDALSTAQVDLEALAGRVESVRAEAQQKLETSLEAQASEYNGKVLQVEMEAQDRLDQQEDGFRKILAEEREELVKKYREKLMKELEVQSEIIDQRLKEEVIAQGIELQRRWIREIKIRVETERGGRLAKLDELASSLKKLESLALDNAAVLDDTVRAHAVWSALRAVNHAVDAPVRRPFRAELRVLRAAAGEKADGGAVQAALDVLERGEVADVGVEPVGALSAWFATAVAPRVESVALVPDVGAGLLAHLASAAVSSLRFRRTGRVEGRDVLSVLARAEYALGEKDLDGAAREMNQLQGVPKELVSDWLEAARRRLEVVQALEVIQSQATIASLLVV